jgi:hypothetical protein
MRLSPVRVNPHGHDHQHVGKGLPVEKDADQLHVAQVTFLQQF